MYLFWAFSIRFKTFDELLNTFKVIGESSIYKSIFYRQPNYYKCLFFKLALSIIYAIAIWPYSHNTLIQVQDFLLIISLIMHWLENKTHFFSYTNTVVLLYPSCNGCTRTNHGCPDGPSNELGCDTTGPTRIYAWRISWFCWSSCWASSDLTLANKIVICFRRKLLRYICNDCETMKKRNRSMMEMMVYVGFLISTDTSCI